MSKPLVIFGTGLYAELAHHYFSGGPDYRVVAFTLDAGFVEADSFCGLPVLAYEELPRAFPCESHEMFIGVGYSHVNRLRKEKYLQARRSGYRLASYVHPSATVARNARLGDNCLVREQGLVGPFARLGHNVFVGARACISHHAVIEDHCYLGPAAVVCGSVEVSEACFIGANATLKDKLRIGANCLIGAGALVLRDCEPGGIYRAEPTARSARPSSRLAKF